MATFEITARQQMPLGGGNRINKGDRFEIYIARSDVFPGTLFGDSRWKGSILQQLSAKDINISSNSPFLSRSYWEIVKK